jgi:hypothetical protein
VTLFVKFNQPHRLGMTGAWGMKMYEMCSICVTILTKLDDLLDENSDGENSDEESVIDIKFSEQFSQSQGCPEGHLY